MIRIAFGCFDVYFGGIVNLNAYAYDNHFGCMSMYAIYFGPFMLFGL
jgi:hypothetical protein